jgi:Glucodextranase, domain B
VPDRRSSLLIRLVLSAGILLATVPAAASAALTSSSVDSPADGSFLYYDDASGPTTAHVTGTANPPGSHVDLRCHYGTGGFSSLGPTSQDIASDATTGQFAADVTPPVGGLCRIHALAANGPNPPDLAPFTGPKVAVSGLQSSTVGTGGNAGMATDYYIASLLFSAGNDFDSVGQCGIDDSNLFDSSLDYVSVFYCNASTTRLPERAEPPLEIDGHPSYSPAGVYEGNYEFFPAFEDRTPFPLLGYSYHIDPATHDLTIHETDHFVRCKPDAEAFPPTAASCTAFADAGVKLDRTIVADGAQHHVRFFDRWSSTNGHAHLLTTEYLNEFCMVSQQCESHTAFRFPGAAAYTVRTDGSTSTGPFPAPGSIFVKDPAAADGDTTRGQGVTTYSVAPDRVYFVKDPTPSGYVLDYLDRSVPANGSLDFRFGYAAERTAAALTGFARQLEDRYAAPQVTIGSPVDGDYTAAASVRVKGTATDTVGVTSFTLNGRPVTLAPGGKFSTKVKLGTGPNKFTALARDAAGNAGSDQTTVVELLDGKPKPGAKRRNHAVIVHAGEALVCPGGGATCRAKLAATAGSDAIGKATVKAPAGKRRELKLELNAKGRDALAGHKHLTIRLKIDILIGTAGHLRTTRSFVVQRPTP